jgi:hypothetical protein
MIVFVLMLQVYGRRVSVGFGQLHMQQQQQKVTRFRRCSCYRCMAVLSALALASCQVSGRAAAAAAAAIHQVVAHLNLYIYEGSPFRGQGHARTELPMTALTLASRMTNI